MIMLEPDSVSDAAKTLDAAAKSMLGKSRLDQGSSAVLFWEMYGLAAGESPAMSLTVFREHEGLTALARRLARRELTETSVRLSWADEQAVGNPIEARTITLDLASLEPGNYLLRLMATVPGQEPVQVDRTFTVISP